MSAFLYSIALQWKLDLRNKDVIVTYYIIPLIFFGLMGGIFTSIDPNASKTLIPSMTAFGITMGAILASPTPLTELYGSDIKKAYQVGKIPLWTMVVNNFISSFIHLLIMSLIIFFAAPLVFDAIIPSNIPAYFLALTLLISASLCIGTLFGVFVKSTSKLTMATQFVFLPSIMLSGIMFSADMLPPILELIGKIFPATWGYINMRSSTLQFTSLFPLLLIIIFSIIVCIWKLQNIKTRS